ncbi:MAG: hypothetical protein PUD40_08025 [Bacteroidales bacterium]|nr:hypothetical protein [Bacteroidales bacterium]
MKKNYTAPQSTVLNFYSEESVMLGASNVKGNQVQLSNKREYEDDNASDGSHAWNSGLWSYEGE